jgi:hypothetical protein
MVQGKREIEWSPEQIAAWLRAEYPDRPGWHMCHETGLTPGLWTRVVDYAANPSVAM